MGGIAGAPCGAVRSSVACVSKSGEHRAQQQKGGGGHVKAESRSATLKIGSWSAGERGPHWSK